MGVGLRPCVRPSSKGLGLQQDRQKNEAFVSSDTDGNSAVLRHQENQFRTVCYQWGRWVRGVRSLLVPLVLAVGAG